jgi:hypothetical protein
VLDALAQGALALVTANRAGVILKSDVNGDRIADFDIGVAGTTFFTADISSSEDGSATRTMSNVGAHVAGVLTPFHALVITQFCRNL